MNRIMSVVFCLAILVPTAADAQRSNTREGFWIGFGLGVGSLGFGGDVVDADRETGLSGYFRLGGTLSQKLLIGGETNGWTKSINGVTTTVGFLGGVVVFYPSATGSFYLKGGLGFVGLDEAELSGSGFALSLGLGNEFRMGNNFSIVAFLNAIGSSGVGLKLSGASLGIDVDPNIVQLGIGVAWH